MPSFKDFMKNILYETVEEEETEQVPETVTEPAPKRVVQTETITVREPVTTAVFGELSADAISRPDDAPAEPARRTVQPRPRPNRQGRPPQSEYQAIISPIFGNMEDEEKDLTAVHNAVELPKPHDNSEMIQVISPMYGNQIPARQETRVEERKMAAPSKPAAPVEEEPAPVMDLKTFLGKKNKDNQ